MIRIKCTIVFVKQNLLLYFFISLTLGKTVHQGPPRKTPLVIDQLFLKAHLIISFHVGFLPYINIPVRYIFPANHVVKIKPRISSDIDKPSCHQGTVPGTPKGILAIITMGELKGIMLAQNASGPVGSAIALVMITMEKMTSKVIGKASDWASRMSSLTELPMAAYNEE